MVIVWNDTALFSHHGFRFLLCVVLKRVQRKWQSVNHFFLCCRKTSSAWRGQGRQPVYSVSVQSLLGCNETSLFRPILRTKFKLTLASFSYFLISACRVQCPHQHSGKTSRKWDTEFAGIEEKRKSTSWIKRTHKLFWFKFWGIAKCDLQILHAELCKCCIVIV